MLTAHPEAGLPWTGRSRAGQAAVELALISTVLLTLLVGAVDFGRALHTNLIVAEAAREGARKAAAYPNCRISIDSFAEIPTETRSAKTTVNSVDYAVAQAGSQLGLGSEHISEAFFGYDSATGARTSAEAPVEGGQVEVAVQYPFEPMTPFAGMLLASTLIRSSTSYSIEAVPAAC